MRQALGGCDDGLWRQGRHSTQSYGAATERSTKTKSPSKFALRALERSPNLSAEFCRPALVRATVFPPFQLRQVSDEHSPAAIERRRKTGRQTDRSPGGRATGPPA